jgi:hypothetical protein
MVLSSPKFSQILALEPNPDLHNDKPALAACTVARSATSKQNTFLLSASRHKKERCFVKGFRGFTRFYLF